MFLLNALMGAVATEGGTFPASSDPFRVHNNVLIGGVPYYDEDAGCTGNGDGDSDDKTCTIAEMEALTDFRTSAASASGNLTTDPAVCRFNVGCAPRTTIACGWCAERTLHVVPNCGFTD